MSFSLNRAWLKTHLKNVSQEKRDMWKRIESAREDPSLEGLLWFVVDPETDTATLCVNASRWGDYRGIKDEVDVIEEDIHRILGDIEIHRPELPF